MLLVALSRLQYSPKHTSPSQRVVEGQASCLEAYAVIGQILGGLDVIPLELSSSRSEPQGYFGLFLSFLILSAPRSAKAVGDTLEMAFELFEQRPAGDAEGAGSSVRR